MSETAAAGPRPMDGHMAAGKLMSEVDSALKAPRQVVIVRTATEVRQRLSRSSSGSSSDSSQEDVTVTSSVQAHHKLTGPVLGTTLGTEAATETIQEAQTRRRHSAVYNYVLIPLALPFLLLYFVGAFCLAFLATWTILPSLFLAKRLYWACPFIPHIFQSDHIRGRFGWLGSWLFRLQFEGAHCMTVLSRLLTLPMRPHLPDFYIAGFPVSQKSSAVSDVHTLGKSVCGHTGTDNPLLHTMPCLTETCGDLWLSPGHACRSRVPQGQQVQL